jgi:uncharacterized membrane protein
MKAADFFTKEQDAHIRSAISKAEENTSGEIRVYIETNLNGDVLDRAAWIFKKIGMHKTEARNGVLFYLAVSEKKFAVIGDQGINQKVNKEFWDEAREIIQKHFREEKYSDGLAKAILLVGKQLKDHFPRQKDDVNELPNDISYDIPD